MIAEIGLAFLWLAAALALLQVIAGLAQFSGQSAIFSPLMKPLSVAQGLLCIISFMALIWCFWQTDLSILLVATNSHVDKPFIFKIAGTWGNHEGSMLLWVTVLTIAGAAIALFEKRLSSPTLNATLMAQGFIALGFFAFLLFASNPFERLDPPAQTGAGLNPLLQDIGLAFHPPTLYMGYVGLSVAFSFAVGAMLRGEHGPQFARAMRPWVLGAWIFLTIGITAGSYWAYYELGWGGWWFWDPVENASLMPWLAATALLHSVSVLATRDALRAWTIMLAVIAFAMAMAGTFLVRSGILTSVHAFAVDPQRGAYLLALMLIYTGAAFILFAMRIGTVKQGVPFQLISRESAIVANNILLSVILGVVLIGTLYPLAAEATGERVSVGPPYFNRTTMPLALLILFLLMIGPMLRWRKDNLRRIHWGAWVAIALATASMFYVLATHLEAGLFPAIGIGASIGLLFAAWLPLAGRRLAYVPLATWGMVVAHFGLGVSALGMSAEAGFLKEDLAALSVGETSKDKRITLINIMPVAGPNWTALEATIRFKDGGDVILVKPQIRYFADPVQQTTEAALVTQNGGQIYAHFTSIDGDANRFQIRIWTKPLVTLIWIGGLLIALGGCIALIGRMRLLRRRPRTEGRYAEGRYA